jgi:hypothetical protein
VPTHYPTANDLNSVFREMNLDAPSATRATALVKAAARSFERLTGWAPFLSSGADETRRFDPPGHHGGYTAVPRGGGRVVRLDAGLIAITSVKVRGQLMTSGADYFAKPNNASPAQYIEFTRPIHGFPQCVEITGKWGFAAELPDDAWLCILRIAMLDALGERLIAMTGGLSQWSEGGASENYGDQPLLGVKKDFRLYVESTINSYTRVTVGV